MFKDYPVLACILEVRGDAFFLYGGGGLEELEMGGSKLSHTLLKCPISELYIAFRIMLTNNCFFSATFLFSRL